MQSNTVVVIAVAGMLSLESYSHADAPDGEYKLDYKGPISASETKRPTCGQVALDVLEKYNGLVVSLTETKKGLVNGVKWDVITRGPTYAGLTVSLGEQANLSVSVSRKGVHATGYLLYVSTSGCTDGRKFEGTYTAPK